MQIIFRQHAVTVMFSSSLVVGTTSCKNIERYDHIFPAFFGLFLDGMFKTQWKILDGNYHGYATEQFCLHKESFLAFLAFFDLFWPFSVMALVQHQLGP